MKRTNLPEKAVRCPRCNERKERGAEFCKECEALRLDCPHVFKESGYRLCVRCLDLGKSKREATFWSQHCRKITRCEACRAWMNTVEANLGAYGHRYDVLEKQAEGQSFYALKLKLQQKVGGKMTAPLQRAIYANEHAKAIVGIECRHLTKQEIAATYTPEYLDNLLARAHENAKGLYCILGEVKRL